MVLYIVAAGSFAYLLFILSDFLGLHKKRIGYYACVVVGAVLLIGATLYCILTADIVAAVSKSPVVRSCAAVGAVGFLSLLVHTLFFALPANDTYIQKEGQPLSLVCTGVYALCRHPGVLWYALFYLCLWLATEGILVFWMGFTTTVWDIVYVLIQDRYIFPKTITGYETYKKTTPFLIPNRESVLRATTKDTMSLKE